MTTVVRFIGSAAKYSTGCLKYTNLCTFFRVFQILKCSIRFMLAMTDTPCICWGYRSKHKQGGNSFLGHALY